MAKEQHSSNLKIGRIVWFTGLSGAGKSTICTALADELRMKQHKVQILDGDDMRKNLCRDLGFSHDDRLENVRRIAHVAKLLSESEIIVLVAVISPLEAMRALARSIIPDMVEAFVDAPLEVCEARDPKGLYKRARAGELPLFTGISAPFDRPLDPDIVCHTDRESIAMSVHRVMETIFHG